MADIERLKSDIIAGIDIVGFYSRFLDGQTIHVKADGWSERVFCPIHGDQKTANFFINTKTGGCKCHACGFSGSIFDFWLKKNGYSIEDRSSFSKALVALATEANIDVEKWNDKYKYSPGATTKKKEAAKEPETYIPKTNKADTVDVAAPPIKESEIDKMHAQLRPEDYAFLNDKRGLSRATIEDYKLGWDLLSGGKTPEGDYFKGRYAIPVRCKKGLVRNVRLYSNQCEPQYKVINVKERGKPPRLFPLERLVKEDWEYVIICEGEFDTILLNQEFKRFGMSSWGAVTGTHGANTFEAEWLQYLFNRHVIICFDADDAGKNAATSHASRHFLGPLKAGKFRSLKIMELPLDGSKEMKDVTDYFVKAGHNIEQFMKLANETPELIVGGMINDETTVEAEEVNDFVRALKDRHYIDKRITVPITISGQSSRTYHAIRSYKVTGCPNMAHNAKGECCNMDAGERMIPYGHELFIQSCMAPRTVLYNELCRAVCHVSGQKGIAIEVIKKVVMEEYFAHQVVKRWRAEENDDGRMQNSHELTQASIYVLQPPDSVAIGPQNYLATGWIRTDPRTQQATFFVETLVPMEDDWKKFTVEREDNRQAIQEIKADWTVDQITQSITEHVTKIYDSDDILYAILLTFLSPLSMNFNGSFMRGWINSAILGDSGTGKSATYTKIADWLEVGDLFSVLSGTRTGLLYAVKQKGTEWHVHVGRYVQASGKIIAVDETQETEPEDIKRMAIAMDTGWLEVSQVASGGYRTQTRTIFLMNPKRGRTISDFSYGCAALRECFDSMFIRRLDIAVFTSNKHQHNFYNQRVVGKEPTSRVLPARLFKALVQWAWTRKVENIIWTLEATDTCLTEANNLTGVYGYTDEIPLVSPQDFRNNLARLSAAYAILDRNFTEDLQSVTILPRHVQAMAKLLDMIYSSTACNLKQYSKQARRRNNLEDYPKIKENFTQIIEHTRRSPNNYYAQSQHFLQLLMLLQQSEFVRKRDLRDQLGVSMNWIQKKIATLQAYNLVEIHKSGYQPTRKFNLFMQTWQHEPGVEKMLEDVHNRIGETAGLQDNSNEWLGVSGRPARDESEMPHTAAAPEFNPHEEFGTDDPFA